MTQPQPANRSTQQQAQPINPYVEGFKAGRKDGEEIRAELLAALKLIRRMGGGLIDGEKTAADVLAKCSAEAGAAIDKAEGR